MSREEMETEDGMRLRTVLNYYTHFGPEDPLFYTENNREDLGQRTDQARSSIIHVVMSPCINDAWTMKVGARSKPEWNIANTLGTLNS